MSSLSKIYVGKNKTIIGSFSANSLSNVHFRCTDNSGNVFMNHKYGLILEYPAEDGLSIYSGYPHMTICNNYFYNVLTRAPGLMRYGYFHCYNNFVYGFNLAYTPYTGINIYSID